MADKKLLVNLQVQTGNSVQNLEAVRDAAVRMGGDSAKSGEAFARALENIQREQDRVNRKITDGKLVTERDGKQIIQQFELLKQAMEAVGREAGEIPAEFQAAFATAQKQVSATTSRVADLSDSVADQSSQLKEGGAQWRGFGQELNAVLGPMGKFQAGAIAGFAALQQGWQMGTQAAKALGTDFAAMEAAMASFTEKAKTVNAALLSWASGVGSFAEAKASISLTKAEFEGLTSAQMAGIRGIDDYKNHTAELTAITEAHTVILKEGAEGQRLASQAKRDANGDLENYIVALNMATDAAKVHAELTKQGAEGDQLWNEIREKGKGNLVNLAQAIRDYGNEIAEVTRKTQAQITAEQALQAALNNSDILTVKRLEQEKQQAELINRQTQSENSLTEQIRAKVAEIQASISAQQENLPLTKLQIQQLQELLNLGPKLTASERASMAALMEKLKTIESMNGVDREWLKVQMQHLDIGPKINAATSSGADLNIKWSESAKKQKLSADEAAAAMKSLKEGGIAPAGAGFEDLVEKVDAAVTKMDALRVAIEATKAVMASLGDEASATGAKLQAASQAGLDDGGAE